VDGLPEDRLAQLEGCGEGLNLGGVTLLVVREKQEKSKIQFVSFDLENVLK